VTAAAVTAITSLLFASSPTFVSLPPALAGRAASEESFRAAADIALREAKPLAHNAYKVELAKRAIVRALLRASKLA
jgi:CO/xanthine dehydrogenase FAD-binding subunit